MAIDNDKDKIKRMIENSGSEDGTVVSYVSREVSIPEEVKIDVEPPVHDVAIDNKSPEVEIKPGTNLSVSDDNGYSSKVNIPNDTGAKSVPSAKRSSLGQENGLNNHVGDNSTKKTGLEQAPDLGKDYGSTPTPSAPPVQSSGENPSSSTGEKPKNESVPSSSRTANNGNQSSSGQDVPSNGGLHKDNDGLHDGKQFPSDKSDDGEQFPSNKSKDGKKVSDDKDDSSKKGDSGKKEGATDASSEKVNPEQTGNGYGALNRGKKPTNGDVSSNARKNLQHSKKAKDGSSSKGTTKSSNTKKSVSQSSSGSSGLGKLKEKLNNLKNRKKPTGKVAAKGAGKIAKNVLTFIMAHPYIAIIIGVVILIFLILFISEVGDMGKGRKGSTHCTYSLSGVVSSGEIELSGLQVELINCDGTESNYTVLETIDFEKYVLGVALAEIGPDSPDEAIKTQIVAARSFALTRNSGMCPGNQDNCFYGYNVSTGKIRMRACEADQVYWDYEKDIYREDRGSISLYSPEVTSGTLWKSALDDSRKQEILSLAEEVKGKVLVDSNGSVYSTNYVASTSEQFISLANEGKTYDEILATVYADSDGFGDSYCSSYGNIDYGDYVLSSDGHEILHQPLDSFLSSQGTSLEDFNALISENVQNAGYGTRAGVVAAAVTLIAELGNNYNVKVPYYWGGGHYDGVVDGALGYWGSTQCHTYANGQSYNYCGLDCSGFVPWAIKNGGFNIAQMLAGDFQGLSGAQRVSLRNEAVLEPGDLLESSGHIVLVVGIEEGNYICAEASGNSAGVLFTRRPFNSSGYWGVKMDGFYDTHVRSQ